MNYSPFPNIHTIFDLDSLSYSDLSILSEVDESYSVEYKGAFDNSVRREKMAKTICAFANTVGGWLFIGLDNHGNVVDIDLQAVTKESIYSSIQSQIAPIPFFHTIVLRNPQDNSKGIIVIYVEPGKNTPYIANGSIFVRNGNESKPADRSTLDILIKQSVDHSDLKLKCVDCQDNFFQFSTEQYLQVECNEQVRTNFYFLMERCRRVHLYIQNDGKHADENIELTLKIPKTFLFDVLWALSQNPDIEYEPIFDKFVGLNATDEISVYMSPRIANTVISPMVLPFCDNSDQALAYMKYLFNMEYCDFDFIHMQENTYIKIQFKQINPQQKMFLPSALLVTNRITEIEYSITGKYSMERVTGKLIKK